MNLKLSMLIGGDFVLALLSLLAALVMRYGYPLPDQELYHVSYLQGGVYVLVLILSSYIFERYDLHRIRNRKELFVHTLFQVSCAFILLSIIYFIVPQVIIGRGVLAIALVLFTIFQVLWHILFIIGYDHPSLTERILVVGTGSLAQKIGDLICSSKSTFNYELAGYVTCDYDSEQSAVPDDTIVGNATSLMDLALDHKANKIVIALTEKRGIFPLRDTLRCKLNGLEIYDTPALFEQLTGKLMLEYITPSWLIFSAGFRRTALLSAAKRMCDIILALLGLLLSLPLFPIIALLVKLDSPGPIFFKQIRVGNWEKKFLLYKFRTMPQDAEKGGAIWAQADDPRVGRIGGFLRKYRLDEIPQLYNVLRGEMSFIGPRPERPEFVEKLKEIVPYYSKRHFVKPGLTGWAQIRYPYGASVEDALEKLRYDLFYIKNMSLRLESIIILETVKVVLFGRGGR